MASYRVGDYDTGKWGFIDKTGKEVTPAQFKEVTDYKNGFAVVAIESKVKGETVLRYGAIDVTGKYIINPTYEAMGSYSSELFPVREKDKWGYIDKTGKYVINPKYTSANSFSESLASVCTGTYDELYNGLSCGYIDTTGKVIIPLQFPTAADFSNGVAVIGSGELDENYEGRKYGYVDSTGKIIINPQFDSANNFYEGRAAVSIGAGDSVRWGFIS